MQVQFTPISPIADEKNSAQGNPRLISLDRDLFLLKVQNSEHMPMELEASVEARLIQFYFCVRGEVTFTFHGGRYQQNLQAERSFLFYNPQSTLKKHISLSEGGQLVFLSITVEYLHKLFVDENSELGFLNSENINKKFYTELGIAPGLMVLLSQLFNGNRIPSNEKLYYHGKALELLSLYFNKEEAPETENCPFLLDEENVRKIRQAKRIIIDQLQDPPSLKELARMVGLNEYKLKVGFKNIYGSPVFQYLTDYKMEQARRLLEGQAFKVNEVGYQLGYSNPSHFIAAFKKKFGTTPKKYLMAQK